MGGWQGMLLRVPLRLRLRTRAVRGVRLGGLDLCALASTIGLVRTQHPRTRAADRALVQCAGECGLEAAVSLRAATTPAVPPVHTCATVARNLLNHPPAKLRRMSAPEAGQNSGHPAAAARDPGFVGAYGSGDGDLGPSQPPSRGNQAPISDAKVGTTRTPCMDGASLLLFVRVQCCDKASSLEKGGAASRIQTIGKFRVKFLYLLEFPPL